MDVYACAWSINVEINMYVSYTIYTYVSSMLWMVSKYHVSAGICFDTLEFVFIVLTWDETLKQKSFSYKNLKEDHTQTSNQLKVYI